MKLNITNEYIITVSNTQTNKYLYFDNHSLVHYTNERGRVKILRETKFALNTILFSYT